MKFKYQKRETIPSEAHPSLKCHARPIIPIKLIYNSNEIDIYALIDSGADWCVFQGNVGQAIGININSGKKQELVGLKQESLVAYFHNIILCVGGWKSPCFVGFSSSLNRLPYGILGHDGFFSQYIVTLDYIKQRIELKERKDTKTKKN